MRAIISGRFGDVQFMFWSPRVPVGNLTTELEKMRGLTKVINEEYAKRIDRLREEAKMRRNDEGNDAFRILQILEHLRR